jgi:hypothetical protein
MRNNFGLYFKKIGLIKFFWGLIIKHFGPYLLGALSNDLIGLAIGPALILRTMLLKKIKKLRISLLL